MKENIEAMKALFAAQAQMPSLHKDGHNPHFKSEFVTLDNILGKVIPVLRDHGLVLMQIPFESQSGVGIRTIVAHAETGEEIQLGEVVVPVNKKDAQGYGSAVTYGRRYGLQTGLCLRTGEDDDGNGAADSPPDNIMSVKARIGGAIRELTGFKDGNDIRDAVNRVRKETNAADDLNGWVAVEEFLASHDADSFMKFLNPDSTDLFEGEGAERGYN